MRRARNFCRKWSRLCGGSCLCRFFLDHGLQAMKEVSGTLRMGSGGEDRPLVVFQDFEPALDIGGMIAAGFGRQAQIGAKERCAKFGDKLFLGIAVDRHARLTPILG